MAVSGKNISALPTNINSHGEFIKPVAIEGYFDSEKSWYNGLNPWRRMNSHYTYSSVRRNVNFRPFRIMKDHLDFILSTTYQHNEELFPELCDIYFQPITINPPKKQFKKDFSKYGHRNLKYDQQNLSYQQKNLNYQQKNLKYDQKNYGNKFTKPMLFRKLFSDHPLIIGGIDEHIHPSSVKLMNSSHHSPQTNAGYVRQDRDGNLFQY